MYTYFKQQTNYIANVMTSSSIQRGNLYGFVWVGFYGISTTVEYLMPNLVFTYILNVYDLQTHFVDILLNNPELIFGTQ